VTHRQVESVVSGQNVYIEITYKNMNQPSDKLDNFNMGIGFFTLMGQFVMVLNSQMANNAFKRIAPEGRIFCHVPKFPLMPGTYTINLTLQTNDTLSDQIINAFVLSVETGDFYGTGVLNDFARQGAYIDHDWSQLAP
jgi:hypothetical protein